MVNKYFSFLRKNRNTIVCLSAIFLIAVFFRFYNYGNRWGLASDQARDAILVTQALQTHSIPLIGAFSASGPFVFGPYMYWFMMLSGIILPFGFISYWIALGILSVFTVLLMIAIGSEIEDRYFGFLTGLFTAVSTLRVGTSTNLIASTLAGVFTVIVIYFFVRSIKYAKNRDLFILGLFIALAVNTHFQTIPLFFLLPVAYFFGKLKVKHALPVILGLIIPFIPLVIFNLNSNLYESTHLLNYFLNPNAPNISKRWFTYLTATLPNIYALSLGGTFVTGLLIMVSTSLTFVYFIIKRRAGRIIPAVGISLALILFTLRYFPGVIFGDFVDFLTPFIIILTAWMCIKVFKANKYLGTLIIILIFSITSAKTFGNIASATNYSSSNAKMLEKILVEQFPKGTKFSVYDYGYKNTEISLPLVLYLNRDDKISDSGEKIGIAETLISNAQLNYFTKGRYTEFMYTLQGLPNGTLVKKGWVSVDPANVYNSVEYWYKK